MLPGRREGPVEGRGDALGLERVGQRILREQPTPVHPGAEIGRDGHVGRGRDDAARELVVALGDLVHQQAKALLGRHLRLQRDVERFGRRDMRSGALLCGLAGEWRGRQRPLQLRGGNVESLEPVPLAAFANIHGRAQTLDLRRRHQAGVIVLVAGERQTKALDRVGDEADGTVVRARRLEGVEQHREIVAAEIAHQRGQFFVAAACDQRGHGALVADLVHQPLAPGRAALERQRRIELVRTGFDPVAQPFAAWLAERGLLQRTMAQHHHVPAEIAKHGFELRPQSFAHDGVEALAVVVDDPPRIAQAVLPAFQQRLENIALVHLGVADERDHLAFRPVAAELFRAQVILRERGEQGLRDAEADRAGREIDVVGILGARRIGLRPLVAAEVLQLVERLIAVQILNRVEHRPGVRLHRDAILRPQRREIERRHDRRGRGAGRLMAADLQSVLARPDVVGVVDRPHRQPQDLALQRR